MEHNNYIPSVIRAEYLYDYKLKVFFDNGKVGDIDCSCFIDGPIFEPLKDKNYFKQFFVDGCTVSWKNGADIAPETLYEFVK